MQPNGGRGRGRGAPPPQQQPLHITVHPPIDIAKAITDIQKVLANFKTIPNDLTHPYTLKNWTTELRQTLSMQTIKSSFLTAETDQAYAAQMEANNTEIDSMTEASLQEAFYYFLVRIFRNHRSIDGDTVFSKESHLIGRHMPMTIEVNESYLFDRARNVSTGALRN